MDTVIEKNRLLDDFLAGNLSHFELELSHLSGHVVEFAKVEKGAEFICAKLACAHEHERNMIFDELSQDPYAIMTDSKYHMILVRYISTLGSINCKQLFVQSTIDHVNVLLESIEGRMALENFIVNAMNDEQRTIMIEKIINQCDGDDKNWSKMLSCQHIGHSILETLVVFTSNEEIRQKVADLVPKHLSHLLHNPKRIVFHHSAKKIVTNPELQASSYNAEQDDVISDDSSSIFQPMMILGDSVANDFVSKLQICKTFTLDARKYNRYQVKYLQMAVAGVEFMLNAGGVNIQSLIYKQYQHDMLDQLFLLLLESSQKSIQKLVAIFDVDITADSPVHRFFWDVLCLCDKLESFHFTCRTRFDFDSNIIVNALTKQSLKEIKIEGPVFITDHFVQILSATPNVEELCIRDVFCVRLGHLLNELSTTVISANLRLLEFSPSGFVGYDALDVMEMMGNVFPNLSYLKLYLDATKCTIELLSSKFRVFLNNCYTDENTKCVELRCRLDQSNKQLTSTFDTTTICEQEGDKITFKKGNATIIFTNLTLT